MHIILQTPRLILRDWRSGDFEPFAAFAANEITAKYVGGVMDKAAAWQDLTKVIGQWTLRGYGIWALEEKATGALAGYAGIWHPFEWPEPELGYALFAEAQGRGLAFEGAAKAREHAASAWYLNPLVSYIDPENTRSRRLAERLGARLEGERQMLGETGLVYRHPKVMPR